MEQDKTNRVLSGCHLATMQDADVAYGVLHDGAVAISGQQIVWTGPSSQLPEPYQDWPNQDLNGRWLLPAFVDCHTHLVYAGNRVTEFEQRLQGASYEQIAKAGGGILSTVAATRAASKEELFAQSRPRLEQMSEFGTGTVEIKSGYGLRLDDEIKMLRVARKLGEQTGVRVCTSFLGAHALPPEFAGRSDEYIELVVSEILPEAARLGLVDAVDVFCESIAFSLAQTRRVLEKATELGLPIRLHAEQLSNSQGAQMAAEMGALSCDHLEYLDEAGAMAMAKAGTVAVLLPGAFYFLNETQKPPVQILREQAVSMAIATDCNPGSSPTTNLPLMANMACSLFGLTAEEALAGITRNGAKALGLGDKIGKIAPGFAADLVAWQITHPAQIVYAFGGCAPQEKV
ncbi:Imidazolonepropionase [hydrothermal vent metagenome]|uniref:imidazolonepropionase n=1 Tax=hydrothermal vent metagenome TaxID=652676 RepID=A0A3B0RVL5_9ZZZZ